MRHLFNVMRHLFTALKEHWQIYVGLLLGLIIGLLVGIGFTDWKSLVKGLDSKVTDWVMSLCTIGILIGTWNAASYAKKAAHQAKIQNNNVIVSKIDDLYKDLGGSFEESRVYINKINDECEDLINKIESGQAVFITEINIFLNEFLRSNSEGLLYKYKFFIEHFIRYEKIDYFYSIIGEIIFIRNKLVFIEENAYIVESSHSLDYFSNLKSYSQKYIELMDELINKINDKYQELNGSS